MDAPQALQVNGEYYCSVDGCSAKYKLSNSLGKHCRDAHEIRAQCKQKLYDRESKKKQNCEASQRYRDKKSCENAMKAAKSRTKLFTYKHAERRGGHMQKDALLKVETSQIPGAGNDVFTCEDLQVDYTVTWYAGRRSSSRLKTPHTSFKFHAGTSTELGASQKESNWAAL